MDNQPPRSDLTVSVVAKPKKKPQPEKANKTSFKPGHTPSPASGRPLGSDKYKPEYDEIVIELGKQGKTKIQICGHLGCVYQTLCDWQSNHPSFSEAMQLAVMYAQVWWEEKGQEGIQKGSHGFNDKLYAFMMKNRFKDPNTGYSDKQVLEHTGDAFRDYLSRARDSGKAGGPINPHKEADNDPNG